MKFHSFFLPSRLYKNNREFSNWWLSVIVLGLLFFLIGYPALCLLIKSCFSNGTWSPDNYIQLLHNKRFLHLLSQSVLVSLTSATVATLLGTLLAVITLKTRAPFRKLFAFTAIIPIILPGFITAIAYIFLFGRNGLITFKLLHISWDVYSWKSVLILQVVDQTATAFLMIAAALFSIGNRLEEAARTLGASEYHILRTVTLKLAGPMILASLLLNFMRAMGDFGTPLIVGGPFDTLASASYTQLIGKYDLSMAATYNVILLLISMGTYYWYTCLQHKQSTWEIGWNSGRRNKLQLKGWLSIPFWLAALFFTVFIWGLVIAVFLSGFTKHIGYNYSFTTEYFQMIVERGLDSTFNTLIFAFTVAIITSFGGQLLAYLTQRVKIPGSRLIDSLATLPFALPGTFIGVGYAIAFNAPPLLLTGTWFIVAMNLTVRKLPLGLRTGATLLSRLDSSLDEASALLGSSRMKTFFQIILPNLRPAMLICFLYAFITTIQALGSIIFIITPGTKLLSVDVFEAVIRGDLGIAAAYSIMMIIIGISGGGLLLLTLLHRKKSAL